MIINQKKQTTKFMRTAESKCLLCNRNLAIQKNSHIIPKFMTKSILGIENQKSIYLVSSSIARKSPIVSQDTAKEDFILCEGCENYFSVLETYIAKRLSNLKNVKYSNQFPAFEDQGCVIGKVCEGINPIIFRLFLYSILWRCSISSTQLCTGFSLNTDEEEELRTTLLSFKSENQLHLLNNIEQSTATFPYLPFVLFTADSFIDKSSNILFTKPNSKNPYMIFLNEYILLISFKYNEAHKKFEYLNNIDESKIKIGYFPNDYWNGLLQNFFQIVANKTDIKRT